MSATPDSTLADPEQLIADLQRQLAERIAERDEALDQQTATAEVLQVINSSLGNLAPVFDTMLEKALRLCDAAFGFMATLDGELVRVVAERGIPAELSEYHRDPYPVAPGTPIHRFLHGAEAIHVVDTVDDPDTWSGASPRRRPYVELGGARSLLAVPLRKDGSVLGCFVIYRQHMQPFSDKQIALLQSFAAQAVIAMENARLLGELRQRTEELTRREAALRNSEERYALAMRAINEGVYEWDVATSEMYYSPRVCELVGLQASELRTMMDWTDRALWPVEDDPWGGARGAADDGGRTNDRPRMGDRGTRWHLCYGW